MEGIPGKTRSARRKTGRRNGRLTNLPPRLQREAQNVIGRRDPDGYIIWELPDDPTFSAIVLNAADNARWIISSVRGSYAVQEPVYYCLVNSPKVKACAMLLSGGFRCVAIWVGALLISQGNLNRLLVMPTMAGYLAIEPRPEAAVPTLESLDTYDAFQQLLSPMPFGAASDAERRLVSNLNSILHGFIVLHEVAHAINGHLHLKRSTQSASIAEDDTMPGEHDDRLVAHVLEWDADAFASLRIFGSAFRGQQGVDDLYHFETNAERLEARLVQTMIAIYYACRMFQRRPISGETVFNDMHPPGAIRLMMMVVQAHSAWVQAPPTQNLPFPKHAVSLAIELCEASISELTGISAPDFTLLSAIPTNWTNGYQRQLLARWRTLQPELLKLKVGTHVLAPADNVAEIPTTELFAATR